MEFSEEEFKMLEHQLYQIKNCFFRYNDEEDYEQFLTLASAMRYEIGTQS
jgi:hypothetical protein